MCRRSSAASSAITSMDHLTPGLGTGAWVVWDPLLESVCTDLPAEKRAAWMDRPPWIALAHELIHGWRLVTGRCPNDPLVFDYYIRLAGKPDEIISGKTDAKGDATAKWIIDGEIRFSGFGAFGRVET
jgi:hypothetical protein